MGLVNGGVVDKKVLMTSLKRPEYEVTSLGASGCMLA